MFTSILIFTKRIRYYVFDFLKEVFHMPFFIPAVISAVTTAATESASMFVAGATSAYRIFHDWGGYYGLCLQSHFWKSLVLSFVLDVIELNTGNKK